MDFSKAEFVTSFGLVSQLPESDKIEIAFAGRSNVGKSSTINKLFGRKKLARVSSVPGKTATINFYKLGEKVNFVDLPGYGFAKVAKSEMQRWSELIDGYFEQERNLRLVVSLIDMRRAPSDLDMQMINFLEQTGIPFIVVMTKSDKLNKSQTQERLSKISSELISGGLKNNTLTILPFSSETGEGVESLREIIETVIEKSVKTIKAINDDTNEDIYEDINEGKADGEY